MPIHGDPLLTKAPSVPRREWTVMVFMVLDDRIEDMTTTAENDLNEMCAAGSSADRNVVVEKHVLATRFAIKPKEKDKEKDARKASVTQFDVDLDENFGAVPTLKRFLLESLQWFPAEHFALILWGHSFELGFGGLSSPGNTLELSELADALGALKRKRPGGKPLDILGTCSCSYSTAEAVVGLTGLVDLLVASESTIPFTSGWPFKAALESFRPGVSPEEICKEIVRQFIEATPRSPVSLTAVDVRKSKFLSDGLLGLADAILKGTADTVLKQSLVLAFIEAIAHLLPSDSESSQRGWVPAVDIVDFAHELSKRTTMALLPTLAADVRNAASNANTMLKTNDVIIANQTALRNEFMNGLLLLAPGTGRLILEIIERQSLSSQKVIQLLAEYARFEEAYINDSPHGYPENWKQTKWPLVVDLINDSLGTMLKATSDTEAGKDWCKTREECGHKAISALTSGGIPV